MFPLTNRVSHRARIEPGERLSTLAGFSGAFGEFGAVTGLGLELGVLNHSPGSLRARDSVCQGEDLALVRAGYSYRTKCTHQVLQLVYNWSTYPYNWSTIGPTVPILKTNVGCIITKRKEKRSERVKILHRILAAGELEI